MFSSNNELIDFIIKLHTFLWSVWATSFGRRIFGNYGLNFAPNLDYSILHHWQYAVFASAVDECELTIWRRYYCTIGKERGHCLLSVKHLLYDYSAFQERWLKFLAFQNLKSVSHLRDATLSSVYDLAGAGQLSA